MGIIEPICRQGDIVRFYRKARHHWRDQRWGIVESVRLRGRSETGELTYYYRVKPLNGHWCSLCVREDIIEINNPQVALSSELWESE